MSEFLRAFIEHKVTNGIGFADPKPEGPETSISLQYTLGRMDLCSGKIQLGNLDSAELCILLLMHERETIGKTNYGHLRTPESILDHLYSKPRAIKPGDPTASDIFMGM